MVLSPVNRIVRGVPSEVKIFLAPSQCHRRGTVGQDRVGWAGIGLGNEGQGLG